MPERKTSPIISLFNWGIFATAWPVMTPDDSESLRRRKLAVRAGHLATTIMILVTVGSAIAADPGKFGAVSMTLLVVASVCYMIWNLIGTRGIVALMLWSGNAPPPVGIRLPRGGALPYFSMQIALAGLVYMTSFHGRIPNLVWLVLLPPVAYAVFLLEWHGITVVSLLMITFHAVNAYHWQGWTYAIFAAVAFSFAVLFTLVFSLVAVYSERARREVQSLANELEAANYRLREYAVQAEELAATRERNRIAREIHDSLGHYLTVVNVQIEAARALESSDPVRAREAIAKAQVFTQEGLQDIRRSLTALRASPLDNKSLADAVRNLVAASNEAGLPTEFELQGTPRQLSSPVELSLYRAVQEGLTNARKHAQAKHVLVVLNFQTADKTSVLVQDDGIGAALENASGGFGLLGLRERAHLLGGTLQIETRPNAGFKLKLEVSG